MLTVWGRKTSSNVQALMWCIGELDLPFHRHDLGHRFCGLDSAEFAALNPNRMIPVLQDNGGAPIWETGAILRYLAARYESDDFWPQDPAQRAQIDKWADWAKINIAMAFTGPVFWQVVRTSPQDQDHTALANALEQLTHALTLADSQLCQTRFLAADTLTLADIQFGHILFRYFNIDIPRPELPALRTYFGRLCARPAFRTHVMISYEELRVT